MILSSVSILSIVSRVSHESQIVPPGWRHRNTTLRACSRCSGRVVCPGTWAPLVPCPFCRTLPRLSPQNLCRILRNFEEETVSGDVVLFLGKKEEVLEL